MPNANDARRTVRVVYTVSNGLRFFEDYDELYWNVTGDEWEVPIRRATAEVFLPDGVTGLRAAAFTGGYGSRQSAATVEEVPGGFRFETTQALSFKEGLTVAVGWDPGVVARPTWWEHLGRFIWANWPLVLPVLSLFGMWKLWSVRGKDPALRPIVPQYEPPKGMAPAEVGTLIDNSPDMRDITATIVDLAVRGFLRIEEREPEGLLKAFKKNDYRFVLLKQEREWSDLHEHEIELLEGLFKSGDTVLLSDLQHQFYKVIPRIKSGIFSRLMDARYYDHRPDKMLAGWLVFGILVIGLGVPAGGALAKALTMSPASSMLGVALSGVPIVIFGIFMPARTVQGTRKLEEVLGFQEFLDKVESDRFKRMIESPEQFEAYLPYAMALQVDEQWAKAFEGMYAEGASPHWYVGTRPGFHFRPGLFVANLNTMTKAAATTMASQPRSSGGSSFGGGGGGFSGGGFGGGGGGGF